MGEIYRDRTDGSSARRQELLRRRREELVTMPHAVRRVIVARWSRIAASMMATAAAIAMIAASWSPHVAARVANAMPGLQPAPVSTLLFAAWVLALIAWAVSRARVEHRFAVAMSRYVLPSEDLDHDVERLDHERPDAIARTMGHDLEVKSAAWPILAAGLLVPASVLWLVWQLRVGGWPTSEFDDGMVAHARTFALLGAIGAIGAIAVTRRRLRQPVMAPVGIAVGLLVGGLAIAGLVEHVGAAWLVAGVAVTTLAIGAIAWTLKRERARLDIEDPAAGSEIFTIRGVIEQVRAGLAGARTLLLRVRRRHWAMVGGAAILSIGIGLYMRPSPPAVMLSFPMPAIAQATPVVTPMPNPVEAPTPTVEEPVHAGYTFARAGTAYTIKAELDETGHQTVQLPGVATVPFGWQASLAVAQVAGELVMVGGNAGLRTLGTAGTTITLNACAGSQPLRLTIVGTAHARVTVSVTPKLTLANCDH